MFQEFNIFYEEKVLQLHFHIRIQQILAILDFDISIKFFNTVYSSCIQFRSEELMLEIALINLALQMAIFYKYIELDNDMILE